MAQLISLRINNQGTHTNRQLKGVLNKTAQEKIQQQITHVSVCPSMYNTTDFNSVNSVQGQLQNNSLNIVGVILRNVMLL
jgi:hypothetical protein